MALLSRGCVQNTGLKIQLCDLNHIPCSPSLSFFICEMRPLQCMISNYPARSKMPWSYFTHKFVQKKPSLGVRCKLPTRRKEASRMKSGK